MITKVSTKIQNLGR